MVKPGKQSHPHSQSISPPAEPLMKKNKQTNKPKQNCLNKYQSYQIQVSLFTVMYYIVLCIRRTHFRSCAGTQDSSKLMLDSRSILKCHESGRTWIVTSNKLWLVFPALSCKLMTEEPQLTRGQVPNNYFFKKCCQLLK